ncbi:hypothetical protein EW146_g4981 [Bondarzewia mesenterica]|uniref:Mediator of RNA polymerase II transcription subunit 20 n=1 Tax=Bondarzewia mesenterica TaxID=1095465 RepID=A0A4V3XEZ8_9AGAM|nr:hypothetical protein EW146_g4981 [Bondarzewia mesenterica]
MSDHVFVLVDDPFAPTRADLASLQPPGAANDPSYKAPEVPHYRNTFLTLSPPGALEQLLTLLRARWISTRQSAPGASQSRQVSAQQVVIDGNIFAIGSDWIVRAGNVILAGGTVKGILLEVRFKDIVFVATISYYNYDCLQAEYLPVSTMIHQPEPTEEAGKESSEARHIPELLSELLLSILPNDRKEKISAVTISDAQWEDVLWDREAEENQTREVEKEPTDDIYAVGEEDLSTRSKSDWEGVGRDRRSAYFIMGALKSERLV